MKKLYTARTRNIILLEKVEGENPHTGKPLKSVRFEFSQDDENAVQDLEDVTQLELDKRRPIVVKVKDRVYLYARAVCCMERRSGVKES